MTAIPTAPAQGEQPSILFACGASILDITSGAALSMRTLLASLAGGGFRAVAMQGTCFDSPQGGEHVTKAAEEQKDKKVLRAHVLGVEHFLIRTKATYRPLMTTEEQEILIRRYREELKNRRPDMVITWGGMLLETTIMREARDAGVPVVFYLVNGGYKDVETFKYVSVIVTDTQATADLYRERLGLDLKPVGKFIDTKLVVAPKHEPRFITFINPSFEKGVNVFMPLAALAAKEAPDIQFLVVQSRGRWGNALKVLGYSPEDFPNVKIIGHQKDMRGVYGVTRALLLPSVWHESGARVIPEALLNGIPVLASNSGGSAELIGRAGRIFDLPETVRENRGVRAPDDVVRPWLEEIQRIVRDEPHYESLHQGAVEESAKHDIRVSTRRFIEAVSPHVLASKRAAAAQAAKDAAVVHPHQTPGATAAPAVTPKAANVLRAALDKKKHAMKKGLNARRRAR